MCTLLCNPLSLRQTEIETETDTFLLLSRRSVPRFFFFSKDLFFASPFFISFCLFSLYLFFFLCPHYELGRGREMRLLLSFARRCRRLAPLMKLLLLLLLLSCVFSRCVFVYRWFDQTSERTRLHTLNFPCMYGSSLLNAFSVFFAYLLFTSVSKCLLPCLLPFPILFSILFAVFDSRAAAAAAKVVFCCKTKII